MGIKSVKVGFGAFRTCEGLFSQWQTLAGLRSDLNAVAVVALRDLRAVGKIYLLILQILQNFGP